MRKTGGSGSGMQKRAVSVAGEQNSVMKTYFGNDDAPGVKMYQLYFLLF